LNAGRARARPACARAAVLFKLGGEDSPETRPVRLFTKGKPQEKESFARKQ
jgi:hypothetical protein